MFSSESRNVFNFSPEQSFLYKGAKVSSLFRYELINRLFIGTTRTVEKKSSNGKRKEVIRDERIVRPGEPAREREPDLLEETDRTAPRRVDRRYAARSFSLIAHRIISGVDIQRTHNTYGFPPSSQLYSIEQIVSPLPRARPRRDALLSYGLSGILETLDHPRAPALPLSTPNRICTRLVSGTESLRNDDRAHDSRSRLIN